MYIFEVQKQVTEVGYCTVVDLRDLGWGWGDARLETKF